MRYWSQLREAVGGNKSQLLTTINETDTWIEDNQTLYNSALTYAGTYTATQKTLIFCAVSLARVSIALLRRVFGEVN